MTVLIRQSAVYEKVFYEDEEHFESIVQTQFRRLLPEFWVVKFKPFVLGHEGCRRRPDLALIEQDYRVWAVVEVELERHSLTHHVRPQIETLVTGSYDESHAATLLEEEPTLDEVKLRELVVYGFPETLVVVNSRSVLKKGWGDLETDLGARLTFLEAFRSESDDSIFALSGYVPEIRPERLVVGLRKHKMMNALVCSRAPALPDLVEETIQVYFEGRPNAWKVVKTSDEAILIPSGGFTVRSDRNYELLRSGARRLELRIA